MLVTCVGLLSEAHPHCWALCCAGNLGAELVHAAADETASLQPAHTYVPWVVVDGVAIGSASPFLRHFVCVALRPGDRPDACTIPGQDTQVAGKHGKLQIA